jgi:hypothetical protein
MAKPAPLRAARPARSVLRARCVASTNASTSNPTMTTAVPAVTSVRRETSAVRVVAWRQVSPTAAPAATFVPRSRTVAMESAPRYSTTTLIVANAGTSVMVQKTHAVERSVRISRTMLRTAAIAVSLVLETRRHAVKASAPIWAAIPATVGDAARSVRTDRAAVIACALTQTPTSTTAAFATTNVRTHIHRVAKVSVQIRPLIRTTAKDAVTRVLAIPLTVAPMAARIRTSINTTADNVGRPVPGSILVAVTLSVPI